ncbi:MAG: DUF4296 domain-containing protein [Mangrovibacterium sp.]
MRRYRHILMLTALLLLSAVSCKEKGIPKPEDLIGKKQMVNILYDIHLSEAMAEQYRYNNPDSLKLDAGELYQGILNKYRLADSTLIRSILYYSSYPKIYEEIYARVIERMNMEQGEMNKPKEIKVRSK